MVPEGKGISLTEGLHKIPLCDAATWGIPPVVAEGEGSDEIPSFRVLASCWPSRKIPSRAGLP